MSIGQAMAALNGRLGGMEVLQNEPMGPHTSFGIGGPADLLCRPRSVLELAAAIRLLREYELPFFLLGKGTNLLVRDGGIRGVVVETLGVAGIRRLDDTTLEAECGATLKALASRARDEGLAGLAFAHGIPGTVGGAVFMNAGAYGGEMSQVTIETDFLDDAGELRTFTGAEHRFGYRESIFSLRPDYIVLRSRVSLRPAPMAEIAAEMEEYGRRRRERQPLELPSAGSTFKRPEGHYAGRLIADCGLKGHRIGGAEVSEKHAGFIVNRGGATCGDVLRLIEHIQNTVQARFGVLLEPEVRVVGED